MSDFTSKHFSEMSPEHQQIAGDVMHMARNHLKMVELLCRQLPDKESTDCAAGTYFTTMLMQVIGAVGPDDAVRMMTEMADEARQIIAKQKAAEAAETAVPQLKRGSLN